MLFLKRITYDYEFMKCKISGQIIGYGDYYYEDDTDGLIVKASVLHELKQKRKEDMFDYSKLNNTKSEREYSEMLSRATKAMLEDSLLDRQIFNKGGY